MKITDWTGKVVAAIAAERGTTKKLKRLMVGAVVGGSLALGAGSVNAQTTHAIQDPSFDEINLVDSGVPFGTGHYAYINDLPTYPWVAARGNNNSWLYNTAYSDGSFTVSAPRSPDNAVHLADGNIFQIIGDAFVSGRTYTLSTWVHYDLDPYIGDDFGLRLFDGSSGIFDGAQIFATQDYSLGVDFFDDGNWHEVALSFTADATADGKPIGLYLGPEAEANRITVDDVTLTSNLETLPGDYNQDNFVDAADYVVWRDTDPNNPDGYNTWRANFGKMLPGGAAAGGIALSVPEPSTCFLACAAATGFFTLIRRSTGAWGVMG